MNCDKYLELSPMERIQLEGKISHLIKNDHTSCSIAMNMVENAERQGKLDNVEIMPGEIKEEID